MKSEQETFEKLKEASDLNMARNKQQEIWHNIIQEINRSKAPLTRKKKGSPLMNVFAGGAGLVATLAVVAGLYTFNGNKVNNQPGSSIPEIAQPSGSVPILALSLPQPSDVASIKWDQSVLGKPNHTWTKNNDASTIDQVMNWLNSAQVIEYEPVSSAPKGGHPGITITTQSGTMVDVSQAYNVQTVKLSNGESQTSWTPQKKYLVISGQGFQKSVRIYAPQLANWIWNGWYRNTAVTP